MDRDEEVREIPAPGGVAYATDLDWLALQLTALYRHDEGGRLVSTREPGARPPPAFVLSRSAHGNLWRFSASLAPPLVRELARLASRELPVSSAELQQRDGPPPPERWEAMRRRLAATGIDPEPEWRGPVFRFDDAIRSAVPAPPGLRRLARSAEDVTRLRGGELGWLADEIDERAPVFAVVEHDAVVGAAWSARAGGRGRGAALEAGVEVAPSRRGRGLGRALVTAWAREVAAAHRVPLYSTAWSNRASRALASRLGLILFGENLHLG